MNSYSVEQYVSDIRTVVQEENSDAAITARIKPFASRLAADKSWIKRSYREVDAEQGFGLHLIHEEENHELAVFVISWAPGGVSPHNHKTGRWLPQSKGRNEKLATHGLMMKANLVLPILKFPTKKRCIREQWFAAFLRIFTVSGTMVLV